MYICCEILSLKYNYLLPSLQNITLNVVNALRKF